MRSKPVQETAAAVARRFGVTGKALRLYETLGLIKPARTAVGWRIYRQPDLERLSAILALRNLGLPLKRIGEILRGGGDLAGALALQEAVLVEAQAETQKALALVRAARARLAGKAGLSSDELAKLIRSTSMSEFKWTDKMEALAQKHYTPEQLHDLRARPFGAEDQARVGAAWAQVFADIEALGSDPDPASDRALDIAARAKALIDEFTQGDPAMFQAAARMNTEALADPETRPNMPMGGAHFAFISKAMAALKTRQAANP